MLIESINSALAGWANYHRYGVPRALSCRTPVPEHASSQRQQSGLGEQHIKAVHEVVEAEQVNFGFVIRTHAESVTSQIIAVIHVSPAEEADNPKLHRMLAW